MGTIERSTVVAADTWGISGPDFLGYNAVVLIVIAFVCLALRLPRRFAGGTARLDPFGLTTPEVGYLTSEEGAVVATLTELVDDGWLRPQGAHVVAVARNSRPLRTPLHAAIHQVVLTQGPTPVKVLTTHPQVRAALADLRAHLHAHGLKSAPASRTAGIICGLLAVGWLVVGLARAAAGLAAGKPVGGLFTELFAGVMLLIWLNSALTQQTTRRARRALKKLRKANVQLQRRRRTYVAPDRPGAPLGYGVALFGTAAVIDSLPLLASTFDVRDVSFVGSGSSTSSTDSGSGGGCGGGGCGG